MDGGSSGAGGGSGEGPWLNRRRSIKRDFSTMSASHRDESPDSLFLPQTHDPHYDNEHSARRRRIQRQPERQREGSRGMHYPGDGLDFRRPVMSASARGSSVGNRHAGDGMDGMASRSAAAPVIDLTDEIEDVSEGMRGRAGDAEMTASYEVNPAAGSSRAGRSHRLPRFGRDLIDVEDARDDNILGGTQDSDGDAGEDDFAGLPGANFLALPPQRSATGRVQYSTLRRPTRQPSPPLEEMGDGDIEYIGSRSFGHARHRHAHGRDAHVADRVESLVPPQAHFARPRSVTPYPGEPAAHATPAVPVAIDLTDEADDDEVEFVDERRIAGVNAARPDLNAGRQTYEGGNGGGFAIGRLAGILRDGGAAVGGRLMQRVQNYNNRDAFAGVDDERLRARRIELEQQIEAHRERRRQRLREAEEHGVRTPAPDRHRYRQAYVPRVRMNDDGTIQGPFQRVGWHDGNGVARAGGFHNPLNIAGLMDYGMAAFDMGIGGAADNRPPTPKYSPPPAPAEGFTRNPTEDEIVVCPNCGDELAVGAEEAKQEIWVIKSCGHAYCGDCAEHRTKTKSKKGKDRAVEGEKPPPPPFKNCVVEGCGKSASAKSMVRVYFGS